MNADQLDVTPHDETDRGETDRDGDAATGVAPTAGRRPRRRIDRGLLIASMVIAAGLVLVGFGIIVSVTGDEASNLPDEIESVVPVTDAVQVLSQSNVVVDLQTGYTGVLIIDGVELATIDLFEVDEAAELDLEPGRQVSLPPATVYEGGNATLTFTPSEGAPIEEFTSGRHEVQVVFWPVEEGRSSASSYTWVFNVV
jgi:hypothetical protein